jgi:hypothetical protein
MRTFLLSSAVALTVASAVNAADCNPSYDVPGSTVCYTNCNIVCYFFFVYYIIYIIIYLFTLIYLL